MSALTDEGMAKVLGWKVDREWRNSDDEIHPRWTAPEGLDVNEEHYCPAFTTSLDIITAEIEARGLDWLVQTDDSGEGHGYFAEIVNAQTTASADTPAKALCAALRDYLKKS